MAAPRAQPNSRSYIATDLGELLRGVGLVPQRKEVSSTTKALSFLKPAAAERQQLSEVEQQQQQR